MEYEIRYGFYKVIELCCNYGVEGKNRVATIASMNSGIKELGMTLFAEDKIRVFKVNELRRNYRV